MANNTSLISRDKIRTMQKDIRGMRMNAFTAKTPASLKTPSPTESMAKPIPQIPEELLSVKIPSQITKPETAPAQKSELNQILKPVVEQAKTDEKQPISETTAPRKDAMNEIKKQI